MRSFRFRLIHLYEIRGKNLYISASSIVNVSNCMMRKMIIPDTIVFGIFVRNPKCSELHQFIFSAITWNKMFVFHLGLIFVTRTGLEPQGRETTSYHYLNFGDS